MVVRRSMILMALLLVLALSGCQSIAPHETISHEGVMDFSCWDFSSQGVVSLNGDWGFYWDKLLSPGQFQNEEPTGYYTLPSYWTRYQGLNLPSNGYATYRLVIKTDGAARLYSLGLPEIYTEYALWINGALMDANGSFTDDQSVYLHPQTYDFYAEGSEIEIVLQVSNTAHVFGGVGQHVRLGTSNFIHKERGLSAAVDLILISIGLFAGSYYLILYLFRKSSRELIWFFLLCLSIAVRNLLSNATLIMQVLPDIPFWLGSKLVTLSIPAIVISMLFYTKDLYKNEIKNQAFIALMSVNALYALIIIITPSGIYSMLFNPYLIIVGTACALGIYLSVKAVVHKMKDSVFFLAGMLLLTAGALLDTVIYMQIVVMNYVLSIALIGFIVLQVVLLAKRYADALSRSELLSNDLRISLDKLKNTETAFLSAQMKPHFLYNTLTTIAEKCETDAKEAGKLILSLSKYLRQTLDYDNLSGLVALKKEIDLVHAYASIEHARFVDIEVIFNLPLPLPPLRLPPLTLQPLVENAIKHGLRKKREGGRVVVSAKEGKDSVLFCVEDNGIGIPEEVLERLVVLPNGSVSIGLYNINTRLIRLYGKGLNIRSKKGIGTSVSFEIPYRKDV